MPHNTFDEIKKIIFARKVGECRSVAEWQQLYSEGGKDLPIDHLSSCASCLDIVNSLLNLPALSDRHPFDAISRDSSDDGPFSASGAGGRSPQSGEDKESIDQAALLQRLRKADSDLFANQPEEITLCVNGWPLTSRRVQTGNNELTVRPQLDELLESLELLDEKGRLLLHLPISEECAAGGDGKWLGISLSPHQSVGFVVTWIDDYPEICMEYCDRRIASAHMFSRKGIFSRLLDWLRDGWSSLSMRELMVVAAGLLILLSIPIGLLLVESSRREGFVAMQREIEALRHERDDYARRFADEQARRQAAESERDLLKQHSDNQPKAQTPRQEPVEIATAAAPIGLRLRQGPNDMEAKPLTNIRGQSVAPIELPRGQGARFTVRLPRYDEGSREPFDGYLLRLSIPGSPPVVGRLKPSETPVDIPFVVAETELLNTDKLAAGTNAEVTVVGVVKKRDVPLGSLPLHFK